MSDDPQRAATPEPVECRGGHEYPPEALELIARALDQQGEPDA